MIFMFLWALVCLASDRIMSGFLIAYHGYEEYNPVIRWMADRFGWAAATILWMCVYIGVVLWLTEIRYVAPLVVILAGYTGVCVREAVTLYRERYNG